MTTGIVIDTDIGDDVDDAFALALATRLPQLALRGVVTVSGPVERRAALAGALLAAAGAPHVPVLAGSGPSLDGRPGSARFTHGAALGPADPAPSASGAPDDPYAALATHASRLTPHASRVTVAPGTSGDPYAALGARSSALTVVALGPLTNLAAALGRDPRLAGRVRVVAMAGKLGLPYPDWNLRCDPLAARRVLASGVPLRMVGMHLTLRAKMRPAQLARLWARDEPLARFLARAVLAWRTWKRRMPILHDALTVAAAADPSLITWRARRVVVGPRGLSLALPAAPPNALVGVEVDIARFWRLLETALL